jgi:hypothetical protein
MFHRSSRGSFYRKTSCQRKRRALPDDDKNGSLACGAELFRHHDGYHDPVACMPPLIPSAIWRRRLVASRLACVRAAVAASARARWSRAGRLPVSAGGHVSPRWSPTALGETEKIAILVVRWRRLVAPCNTPALCADRYHVGVVRLPRYPGAGDGPCVCLRPVRKGRTEWPDPHRRIVDQSAGPRLGTKLRPERSPARNSPTPDNIAGAQLVCSPTWR